MTATQSARSLLEAVTFAWVDDPDSDVVWAGEFEGRWGIRMAQQNRDFTTVWFDVGGRTVRYEAYLLPSPPKRREDVYAQALRRNWGTVRCHVAADRDGDLYVTGRTKIEDFGEDALEEIVGCIYELVDLAFPAMVRAAFSREK